MNSTSDDEGVVLRLDKDEALVLFEWIQRHERNDSDLEQLVADPAERDVLQSFSACLERLLVEPFKQNYDQLLEAARARLRPAAD